MRRPANRGLYPQKNVVGKTLDLGDTVLMGTATRFTRPLTRVRGQDFQRAGGSPRDRERLPLTNVGFAHNPKIHGAVGTYRRTGTRARKWRARVRPHIAKMFLFYFAFYGL